ncbi:MAG: hypothetical protein ACNS60_15690 [Candidatus Cyclobacteriaceae bacterium M2_1C_046]
MKKVGLGAIILAAILFILYFILGDPAYTTGDIGMMQNSFPIAASFLFGAGIGLFLGGYSLERQKKRRKKEDAKIE